MALTTGAALALAAASAALQHQNTVRTANRADSIAAQGIRDQSKAQQKADAKVNQTVDELAGSTAEDARAKRLSEYATTLRAAKGRTEGGLDESQGGAQFARDITQAKGDLDRFGADRAGKLATVDAAGMQRQGEGFRFGNLATDIGLVGRESQGIDFLTRLRSQANRRNPWMDAGASFLGGVASGGGSAAAAPMTMPSNDWLLAAMRGAGRRP